MVDRMRTFQLMGPMLAVIRFRVLKGVLHPILVSKLTTGRQYSLLQVVSLFHTFLGLLAKIKCSICSLEFDNSNGGHCPPCYLTYFSGGLPNSDACIAGLAAWPWHCTTALAEHPLINDQLPT